MDSFFAALSKRQAMLGLTALAFGGARVTESFRHLSPEDDAALRPILEGLLRLPREQRVVFITRETKRQLATGQPKFSSANARQLTEALRHERPAMVDLLLRALPFTLAEAIRAGLPNQPTLKVRRPVKSAVLSILRWKLERLCDLGVGP